MPDTPVIVDGDGQRFTIRLPEGERRAFTVDGTLGLASQVRALQIVVTNGEGLKVTLPLGTRWRISIEDMP